MMLANDACSRRIAADELGAKAILPKPQSVQKANSYQLNNDSA